MYVAQKFSFLIALIAVLLAAGCKPTPNMRGPQKLEGDYEQKLRKWTRSDQVYNSLNSTLLVHVTYLSPEFLSAFRKQYVRVFGLQPQEADSDLEGIAKLDGTGFTFFVFADSPKVQWNNLDSKDSVWRLGLWGAGAQDGLPPTRVKPFDGRGPNLKAFFPFLNQFGRSYLVVFPKTTVDGQAIEKPDSAELTMKLSSVFGIATLNWAVTE